MHWSSVYVGPTTAELRQLIARRAEFYLGEEHEKVISLFGDRAGFIVHPSTLVEAFGWPKYRAVRVLEEIAEAFALPSGTVSSPHGEAEIYVWGRVIESGAWPVSTTVSYRPVIATVPDTVPVPVPRSAPAPEPAQDTGTEAAARRAMEGTRITKPEAARGLVSYAVESLGMEPDEAAEAMIALSRAGRGVTRAALAERAAGGTEPVQTDPEERITPGNSERRCALLEVAAARPELARTCAVLDGLLDHRDVPVGLAYIENWDGYFQGVVGDFTRDDAYRAVSATVERGSTKLEDVASSLAGLRRVVTV